MALSVLDLFTIGIGPSSSHAIGPMRAAGRFLERLRHAHLLEKCERIEVKLYASLALTGKGHGTDKAILLGLVGETPEGVDPDQVDRIVESIRSDGEMTLPGGRRIRFDEPRDLLFLRNESLPYHPNGMEFTAYDAAGEMLDRYVCYSIGGGFVVDEQDAARDVVSGDETRLPYPYHCGDDLLSMAAETGLSISAMTLANEERWRSRAEIEERLLRIWRVMQACVERGCREEGTLPGGLKVKRRAPELYRRLAAKQRAAAAANNGDHDTLAALDWVNLYALATSEENAAGGRVVTAPTNGAAGIIPAVLHYYRRHTPDADDAGVVKFLLTAGAIGILYKLNASISGAEVGCQGEVGVACSMAGGALTEVLGGTPRQVEMAAEIGMEHNLGLTCDPIGGLVQVPCIERCAMGAVKAINASRMALGSDGEHRVSLDRVIRTMRETGRDMLTKYKETSRGGLAVAVTEC
ncbi:L-serine ammonia-lyase [Lacipirellula parvula]|uniref:L-serine dehydratase n=1 Tax=Lacipirellula parvula TaxID=2650471 RepID=A0A5K7X3C6_9BACT|nr:L-serine ammonia-lyase [Lacipirellula parvula]BBO31164.1 L-serine dehydratase beta subunit [Lacipirellula parvula]